MKKLIMRTLGAGLNALSLVAPAKAGHLGFRLFCYPFRAKITNKQRRFLESGEGFRISLGQEFVQGYRWGNGPLKILFLHGWQSHSYRWKSYINALDQEKYSVYAIDAPAHGLSSGKFMTVPLYSQAIKQVIEHIGKTDVVVSHSLGGFAALYAFFTNPEVLPERLVLTAPPGQATEFLAFFRFHLGISGKAMRQVRKQFLLEVGQEPEYFSAPAFAEKLTIPGLIIHDEHDDDTPVENSREIHRAWKNSQLVVTHGKGHNLKSMDVVNQVVEFIGAPVTAAAAAGQGIPTF